MAEDMEPGSGKKHRIIHWNPDAGNENVRRRWTLPRILLWSVIGFVGVLFAAGIVIRGIKLVKPDAFGGGTQTAAKPQDPMQAFQSQNDARFALDTATKAVATLSKLPFQDHPKQVEKFLLIQKDFDEGTRLYAAHEYAQALVILKGVNARMSEFALSIQTKQEAQNLSNALILKIKDLETARILAPEALTAATTAASNANRLLADGDFLLAKRVIEQGMAELKKAEDVIAEKVKESIWNGQQALTRGSRQEAAAAFRAALERAPDNDAAKQGLKRAETIDRVHALNLRAAELEKNGDYEKATESYKAAFELDSFSAEAQQGQARAVRLNTESKFDKAFKGAQDAFTAKDWEKAITQAKAALAVNSQKTEVSEMLKNALQSQHDELVQKAMKRGRDAEDRYDWVAAKDAYEDANKVEPSNTDAKDGIVNSSRMIRALKAYEAQVEAAEVAASRNDFQRAISAFNQAMQSKPSYLAADEKTQQLHALLQSQKDPVEVTFKSDEKTFVTIEGFQNLSVFSLKSLKILPGDYTIVGRRMGYKEVAIPIQIRGGAKPPVISVICTVKADKP